MGSDNHIQEYLTLYKGFEQWTFQHYPDAYSTEYLENNYALASYSHRLEFFRKLRNLLTHYDPIGQTPLADMIVVNQALLDEFTRMTNEITLPIINKCIPRESIISCHLDDNVLDSACDMMMRNYTHIPILEDERVIGVFGENSLLTLAGSRKQINQDTTFRDIMNYIGIGNCSLAGFTSPQTTIPACKNMFSRAIYNGERLDIVFITEDGTRNTPLMGLVTVWDLPVI